MNRSRALAVLLAVAGLAGIGPAARAEGSYPERTVEMIVGFAPGGGVDQLARAVAKKLGERLGQTFVVVNRPGAGGTIGTSAVARAAPDGYTLLFTSIGHAINQSLYPKLSFDSVKDFVAISPVATAPNAISANPSAPFKTLGELVDYAKKNPGKVTYGAIGGSTTMYLGMAMLEARAGIKMSYVPYNGTVPSVMAAVTGEVQVVSSGYGNQEAFIRDGKLRLLAVTTARPSPVAPGAPTVAEAAQLPGFEIVNWMGVFAPAGTPAAITDRLNAEIRQLLADPEMRRIMDTQKVEPFHATSVEFEKLVAADVERFAKIVRQTNAKTY